MKFRAEINVMPLKELLDPQGKAVASNVKNIGLPEIKHVRIGKHITVWIEANNKKEAEDKTELACKKLLANRIMEYYEFTVYEN